MDQQGNSPYVENCIVFGDARPQVGCLLKPSELAADVWKDRNAYLALVWPVIEAVNGQSPTHSRILPEMVEILPIDTEIPVVGFLLSNFGAVAQTTGNQALHSAARMLSKVRGYHQCRL